jgi:trehalose-phosphatase
MEQLRPEVSPDHFFARLATVSRSVLFLDYDGTLAPFRSDPSQAHPYPGVRSVLRRIIRRPRQQVVIVTGRRAGDLLPLLPEAASLEVWGAHGWERRMPDGTLHLPPIPEPARLALEQAYCIAQEMGMEAHCETKPGSLAFHHRSLPASQLSRMDRLHTAWSGVQRPGLLHLCNFDGGMELRAVGKHKGDVVRTVLAELPAGTPAAYLGDDLTDEDAFQALAEAGLCCLVRPEFRPTAAHCWVRPPEELLALLERWDSVLAEKGDRHGEA